MSLAYLWDADADGPSCIRSFSIIQVSNAMAAHIEFVFMNIPPHTEL
jgi:hypothetical protein